MNSKKIKKCEKKIIQDIRENISNLSLIIEKKFKAKDINEMLNELGKSLKSVSKRVKGNIKKNWKQSKNTEKASLERHDLYGNLTKVNFGIEYLKMAFKKDFSNYEIKSFEKILENNRDVYNLLKEIFTQN